MEMATNPVIWDGFVGLYFIIFNLSNFKLMQEVVVYFVVALAIVFLINKYVFPTKKDKNCNTDCGCH
jgi:hypothetical protein